MKKTNAMRLLDIHSIDYEVHYYDINDGMIDGISVSNKIRKDPNMVLKTLLTINDNNIYVFILPVNKELDMKLAAKLAGEKKLTMLPVKDIIKTTGYIRGGCSPLAMKKAYETIIDESILGMKTVIVSAGKIGLQIEMKPCDLIDLTSAQVGKITK